MSEAPTRGGEARTEPARDETKEDLIMGDWTTGRGFSSHSVSGPSQAEIARLEYEAELKRKETEPKRNATEPERKKRRVTQFTRTIEHIRSELEAIRNATPRNRKERRIQAAVVRDLLRELEDRA